MRDNGDWVPEEINLDISVAAEPGPTPSSCDDYIDISPISSAIDVILDTAHSSLPCSDCFDLKTLNMVSGGISASIDLSSGGDSLVDSANMLAISSDYFFCNKQDLDFSQTGLLDFEIDTATKTFYFSRPQQSTLSNSCYKKQTFNFHTPGTSSYLTVKDL